jgi:hypothetical protein
MGLLNMRRAPVVILSTVLSVLLVVSVAPAFAATAEPTANTLAWYGQDQFSREVKDPLGQTFVVDSPNPFCPSAPGSLGNAPGACAEGRLPVEVRGGNYEPEEQNKISAVGFDLSLVPLGSKVSKFTATFLEAKAGCYKTEDSQDPKPVEQCEETDPINVEGKEVQACLIEGFLTEGLGRPFNEAPRFTCSDSDPFAQREEVKTKDGDVEHVWTFDLTKFAQGWVEDVTSTTAIMLVGKAPKQETGADDSWRVVFTGPKFEAGNIPGLETKISYIPGKTPALPVDPIGDTTGTTGTTDFGGTSGTTDFGGTTGTTDFGSSTGSTDVGTGGTTDSTAGATDDPAAAEEPPALAIEGAETVAPPMPGYVWLAILAGIVAFTLVRSVVLESASGIRPNGVLAQIQRLNAERNGVAATTAGAGGSPFAPVAHAFTSIKEKAGSLGSKLNFRKKG